MTTSMVPPQGLRRQIRLGIVGYGEVGHGLALGLHDEGLHDIYVYQRRPDTALNRDRSTLSHVMFASSLCELAERSDIIIAATPGTESLNVATAIAPALLPRHIYLDIASATPDIKRRVGDILAPSGAQVGDGAIEGSPLEDGHRVRLAISGPAAEACALVLVPWGVRVTVVGDALGDAAAIRLLRTIMQKGLTAVLLECAVAAGHYGLRAEMLRSIAQYYDDRPFMDVASRMLRSTAIHAGRRAQEAAMAATTLQEIGVEPIMTSAASRLLARVAALGLKERLDGIVPERYEDALDAMEPALRRTNDGAATSTCGGIR